MKKTVSCYVRFAVLALAAFGFVPGSSADVRLPALFADHMVLQQGSAAEVWGWADPHEVVTVSIAGQKQAAKAGSDGKWRIQLHRLKPGGPHTLTIVGKNTVVISDVLIGEVWLGSGQSNMAMKVREVRNFEHERTNSNLPQIRVFKVESGGATNALEDCTGHWQACSPETVGEFSATLFLFGREIHQALGLPVGLINSSVGATPIEAWTSPEAQRASVELKPHFTSYQGIGELFNGKIAPLAPYTIRGAIWYQGEANANSEVGAHFYEYQLPLLIKDWRARWGYDFPFAWAQLPNYGSRSNGWCLVRDGQLKSLKVPHTGMAITVDIGETGNIHPKNKQEVGRRLSLWALGDVYGKKVAATSGPIPDGDKIRGKEIVVAFKHTEGGLIAHGGDLRGFEVAGADKQWKAAQARIDGRRVIVSSSDVPAPVALRYAWRDNPDCTLYNDAGLPASPFRTDNW